MTAVWIAIALLAPSALLLVCGARGAHNAERCDKPARQTARPARRQKETR